MENSNINKRIGLHLKKERLEKAGKSQEAVAMEFYVDTKTWQRYEQGVTPIPTYILVMLHEKWGTDLTWLLTDKTLAPDDCKKRCKRSESVHNGSTYGPKGERT